MEELTLDALLGGIKSDDPDVRTKAWLAAGQIGAPALAPLAKIVAEGELEVSRAAKRAMWQIVRTVGAPGRSDGKAAAETGLIGLLGEGQPDSVRREVFWMLSEIGGEKTIDAIREGTGKYETFPLMAEALEASEDEFQLALAQSLRARGVEVDKQKYPCKKLVPTKETSVEPVAK